MQRAAIIVAVCMLVGSPAVPVASGQVGIEPTTSFSGAGVGYAECDVLGTACAATLAAAGAASVEACAVAGSFCYSVSAVWGAGAAGGISLKITHSVVKGEVTVVSEFADDSGGDDCAWYEFWCWFGASINEPGEAPSIVAEAGTRAATDAAGNTKATVKDCFFEWDIVVDPTGTGAHLTCTATNSALENAQCMSVEAEATSVSSVFAAEPPTATAKGCREAMARAMLAVDELGLPTDGNEVEGVEQLPLARVEPALAPEIRSLLMDQVRSDARTKLAGATASWPTEESPPLKALKQDLIDQAVNTIAVDEEALVVWKYQRS